MTLPLANTLRGHQAVDQMARCPNRTQLRTPRALLKSTLESLPLRHQARVPGCRRARGSVTAQLGIGIDFPGMRLGKVKHDKMGILEGSLDGIHDPAVNIAIQRRVPPIPETELQKLLRPLPTTLRSTVHPFSPHPGYLALWLHFPWMLQA